MTCPEVSCPSFGQGSGYIVPPVQTTLATTRHADQLQTGLDISSREGDVQKYFENGLVPSTRRTYQGGINKFVKFCGLYNIINPLPVSQSLLCSYTSHLDNSGLVYGTIKKKNTTGWTTDFNSLLSCITHVHTRAGHVERQSQCATPPPELTTDNTNINLILKALAQIEIRMKTLETRVGRIENMQD